MKKMVLACSLIAAALWSCGPGKDDDSSTGSIAGYMVFEVTEDSSFINQLPDLQSFVFGSYENYWIMFSGRRNGFHGFNTGSCDTCYSNFPSKKANDQIFLFNKQTHTLDSIAVPSYGGDTANVFRSTNLPHTQQGNFLYACGGYGIANANDTFARKTYSYFMKMDLTRLVAAFQLPATDSLARQNGVKNSIKWGKSNLVQNTGGELFLLPDNNFYLCVGHSFSGRYSDSAAVQVYQDAVNVFSVSEFGDTLSITQMGSPISDGLPAATSQFHRRDLIVAPCVQPNGSDIGISIYGGVFTVAPGSFSPFNSPPEYNYTNPIYINYQNSPKYKIETGVNQYSNIYSAAYVCMYDSSSDRMLTTIFGGIGNKVNELDSNADWTKLITTVERNYANNTDVTSFNTNDGTLPAYLGAEAVFVPAAGLPYYNQSYGIVNYATLTDGQVIGHIYGGIQALNSGGNSTSKQYGTWCTNKVYKVTFRRIVPVAAE